jgi:hypothetical protein
MEDNFSFYQPQMNINHLIELLYEYCEKSNVYVINGEQSLIMKQYGRRSKKLENFYYAHLVITMCII